MVLSDVSIKKAVKDGRIVINPYDEKKVQPSSYDVTLDNKFLIFKHTGDTCIDPKKDAFEIMEEVEITEDKPFVLHPGEFALASLFEWLEVGNDLVARIEGKSSLGRIGLLIHSTAGYIDPGWKGKITLELSNVAKLPILLHYKMKIGQLSFSQLTEPAENTYGSSAIGSKYQHQGGPVASKMHLNFKEKTN